jgi:hypothetical protein
VAGFCEDSNELLGSIKHEEFLGWLSNCYLLKKDSAPWSWLLLFHIHIFLKSHSTLIFLLIIYLIKLAVSLQSIYYMYLQYWN